MVELHNLEATIDLPTAVGPARTIANGLLSFLRIVCIIDSMFNDALLLLVEEVVVVDVVDGVIVIFVIEDDGADRGERDVL